MALQHPRDMREWMAAIERRVREASRNGNRIALSAAQKEAGIVRDQIEAINNLTPAAPIELTYETSLYIDRNGKHRGRFFIEFPDVVKATDGTDIIVDHYELHGRREGVGNHYSSFPGHLTPGKSFPGAPGVTAAKGTLPELTNIAFSEESYFRVEDFNPGDAWRFRVRAFANIGGKPGVWSIEVLVNFDVDTTPPPQPTVPTVTAVRGQLIVESDGQSVTGPMPPDHDYTILAGGYGSSPTEEIYRFPRQGGTHVVTGLGYHKPYFVRLQAVDTSGNHGPWSEQAVGIPTPLVDADVILSQIDAGKTEIINAGELLLETGEALAAKLDENETTQQAVRDRLADAEQTLNVTFPAQVNAVTEAVAAAEAEAAQAATDAAAAVTKAEQAARDAEAAEAAAVAADASADASAADAAAALQQAQAAGGDAGAAQAAATAAQEAADAAAASATASGTSAAAADAKAAQAAADAAQAVADAAAAASSATTAEQNAVTARQEADAAAAEALAAQGRATASATAAADALAAAEQAELSASTATGAAATAETAADQAASDAAAALAQATASGTSASDAQAAATAAQTAADTAKAEAITAGTAAAQADADAAQAAADAAQAAADALAAAGSASTAAQKATSAETAATTAQTNATEAAQDAAAALTRAQNAEAAADAAEASAIAAGTAADASASDAAAALTQAQNAGTNATAAQTAADNAQTAADAAAASAQTAGTEAAAADASAAQAAADAAQAVADAAKAAQDASAAAADAATAATAASTAQQEAAAIQAVADEAERIAREAAGLAGTRGRMWFQADPPPAGTTHEWLGAVNASVSVQKVNGVEVRRNLFRGNPNFEVNTSSWAVNNLDMGMAWDGSVSLHGVGSAKITNPGSGSHRAFFHGTSTHRVEVAPGTQYTVGLWVKGTAGTPVRLEARRVVTEGAAGDSYGPVIDLTGEWQLLTVTQTATEFQTQLYPILRYTTAVPSVSWVDSVITEVGDKVGDYFDGSTPDDRSFDLWTDTDDSNKPHRWDDDTDTWVEVTDQRVIDAAADAATATADAAQAKLDAQSAAAAASSAEQEATDAKTAASTAQANATSAANDAAAALARAEDAEAAALAAESSADTSAANAASALTQAQNAGTDAAAAQTAANAAQTAADEAAASASVAGTEAAQADAAAAQAAADAAQALADAAAAAQSASTAQTQATNSASEAEAARLRAEAAETSAGNASSSATAAQQAAVEAEEKVAAAIAQAPNRLANSSFERGLENFTKNSVLIVEDDTVARTGTKSVRIDGGTTNGRSLVPEPRSIPVAPGEVWRLSAWAKNTPDYNGTDSWGKLRLGANQSLHIASKSWMLSESWLKHTIEYTVPADGSVTTLEPTFNGDHATGTLWIDDIELREVSDVKALEAAAQAAEDAAATATAAAQAAENAADASAGDAYAALQRAQAAEGDATAAQTAANQAQTAADNAAAQASTAGTAAAQADAAAAQSAADAAQAVADAAAAASSASAAQTKANTAAADAATAAQKATDAESAAGVSSAAAQAAETAADDAATAASNSLAQAQAAGSDADAAQAAATAAQGHADTAAAQATTAGTAAAQADAAAAQAAADAAQAVADAALAAQEAADAATSAASAATNASDAQTAADTAQAYAEKMLDSARSVINPATSIDGLFWNGSRPLVVADSPTAMGGKAIGKDGTGSPYFADKSRIIPIDPNVLYRLTMQVRVVRADSGTVDKGFYLGAMGYADADGNVMVNSTGTNTHSSQHWVVSNIMIPEDGNWYTYAGYMKGISAGNATGSGTLASPKTFNNAAKYFSAGGILDYNNGNGHWEVSYWTVDAIDPIGHQALLDAATAQTRANEAHTLAGTAQGNATNALTIAGGKSRVYYSTSAPSGTANPDDTWRQTDASGNVTAEWRWTTPGWTSQQVTSAMVSNLDVGKLTVGTGVIADLVAQHIAAQSGKYIELDVSQLNATTASIDTAVIDKLWTDVVNSRQITTNMLVVGPGENIWPDRFFVEPTKYTLGANYTGAEVAPKGAIRSIAQRDHLGGTPTKFNIEPGQRFVIDVTAKRILGALPLNARVWLYGPNGENVSSPWNTTIKKVETIDSTLPDGWVRYRYTAEVPPERTDIGQGVIYFQIDQTFSAGYTTEWLISDVSLREQVESAVIVDGAVTTRKLTVTEDMTVALLAAHKVQANEIEVNTLFADNAFTGSLNSFIGTFLTNEDGSGYTSTVTGQGLKVTYTDPVTGEVSDRVKLGTFDGDYLALNDDTGEVSISMDKTGTISTRTLDVRDEIYYKGTSLTDILNAQPKLTTWGQIQVGDNMSTTTEVGLFEVGWETANDDPIRMYEFNVNPFIINQTQAGIVGLRLRYTTDGSAPTINSPVIGYSYFNAPAGLSTTGQFTRIISSSNGPYIRVLLCLYDNTNGVTSIYQGTGQTHLYFTVKDLGIEMPRTGNATTGGGSVYTGSTVAAPTNPTVTRTSEWGYNGVRSYLPSGAHYNYNPTKAYQGQSPAGYGNLRSMYTFPSLTSTLSGASIHDIWVYLYFEHWYYNAGGTAYIRLHDNLSIPATYSGMTTNGVNSANWPKGAGRWVRLPSSLYDGFKTGAYRGFGLAGIESYAAYGIANNARIRIRYTK